jgi:choline dehydrogenase-like flavoprotein
LDSSEADDVTNTQWDAIIIGAGLGGCTLGYALARAGRRVLFCEKGKSHLDNPSATRGAYPELFFPRSETPKPQHREILSSAGRCYDQVEDQSTSRHRAFIPFIGSGTGGSSALYGMAMERFSPADFEPRRCHPDVTETTLPEQWPISYADFLPYYELAEDLYRVRGAADPLREAEIRSPVPPAPPLTPLGKELFDFFTQKGLHPYRLPMACEFVPGCTCCQGYLCDRNCKNDSSRVCLEPALSLHGAKLLDACEVFRLEATRTEVTGIVCTWRGKQLTLRGKIVALAAGALQSPCILLNSASASWPQGLANDSGLVGRNLMRHCTDLYLLSPKTKVEPGYRHKEIALNDFYHANGKKLGTVQSFGHLPPASMLTASLEEDLRNGAMPFASTLFRMVKPIVTPVFRRAMERRAVLATVMEDLPYRENRVSPISTSNRNGEPRIKLSYTIRPRDLGRIKTFRALMANALKPYRTMLIKQAENNQLLAHACGTCRFGVDPRESVLDPGNRAHGLSNLYVVDSSFFPSSGGTNPGLTIAANALRVAAHLSGEAARKGDS